MNDGDGGGGGGDDGGDGGDDGDGGDGDGGDDDGGHGHGGDLDDCDTDDDDDDTTMTLASIRPIIWDMSAIFAPQKSARVGEKYEAYLPSVQAGELHCRRALLMRCKLFISILKTILKKLSQYWW